MHILKTYFSILCLLVVGLGFSQNIPSDSINKAIPVSIYTSAQISSDYNRLLQINKRLNLQVYKFISLDEKHLEMGNFSVPLYNISLKPSNYIYDSYNKKYQQSILEAAFFNIDELYWPRSQNSL